MLHQVEPLMLAAESHEVHAKQITDMRLHFFFLILLLFRVMLFSRFRFHSTAAEKKCTDTYYIFEMHLYL